jgi:hypothetical protein
MDLDELFGPISGGVMVGFTGSTQGVGETQEILSWDYVYRTAAHPLLRPTLILTSMVLVCRVSCVVCRVAWAEAVGNTEAGKSEAYGPGKEKSVAGQEGEFTIQAVDQFGYNITVGGENFTVTIDPTTPDPLAAPGTALPSRHSNHHHAPGRGQRAKATTHRATVCCVVSLVVGRVSCRVIAVEVTLKDNGDGTYSVSYRGTTATAYTVHARFQGSDIKESPWTMTIDPADIDPAQCTGSGSFTGGIAGTAPPSSASAFIYYSVVDIFLTTAATITTAITVIVIAMIRRGGDATTTIMTSASTGEQLTLEVQAKDTFGNKLGKQFTEATFRAQFSNGLEADFAAEGDEGLYKATYAIDQQGLYSIEVLFVANATTTIPIQGTPLPIIPRCIGRRRLTALQCLRCVRCALCGASWWLVAGGVGSPWANCTIVPADPEAAECYAQGEGLQFAIAGASGNFSIVPRDRFNNTLHAGLPPSFAFKGAVTGGSADLPVTIQAVAGENGTVTYAGSYTVTTAGAYSLELFLGEAHIAGSPFPLSVIPSTHAPSPPAAIRRFSRI